MKVTALIVLAALGVAGCANWKGYEKAGVAEAQVKKDMTECRHSAEIYDRGIIPPLFPDPNTKARVVLDNKAYRKCMVDRGYKDTGWGPREWLP